MSLDIVGAGGFAKEVASLYLSNSKTYTYVNLFLPPEFLPKEGVDPLRDNSVCPFRKYVIAIGSSKVRKEIVDRFGLHNALQNPLISKHASIQGLCSIESGTIICAGARLTMDIQIGRSCIINLATTIGHDSVIEDYVTIAPGVSISGNVHIEEGVEIGSGAIVLPNIRIGANSVIGAGSVVTKDIPANVVAYGNPCKVIREID